MPLTDDEVVSQLTQYWNTSSLTFEAEFHLPKNKESLKDFKGGYFRRFNIPGQNQTLRYPSDESGISFRYKEGQNLKDGRRYRVTLIPEVAVKRLQNPLLLRIEKVSEISGPSHPFERPKVLKSFYGQYRVFQDGRCCFADLMFKDNGEVVINKNGTRTLAFFLPQESVNVEENAFYEFKAQLESNPKRGLEIKVDLKSIIKLKTNPYLEVVQFCYSRMDGPVANKMLANMMREIGKGLYSSRQRMVFELLQNADDTPAGPSLIFNLGISGDYLTIYHNGLPFSSNDVRAITSAAQSTKRADAAKTGYKGIGFKSVFTETDEVLVRSGGFQFVFMRNHPSFQDFDEFYFNREEYKLFDGLKERNLKKFSQERQSFNFRNDIPWQMIPHWENKVPDMILETGKIGIHSNVFFAINFGQEIAAEYLRAVYEFAAKPHFMLFLRNVTEFNAGPYLKVKKSGESPVIITRTFKEETSAITYLKRRFTGIKINDEAFKGENIALFKKQEENRYGAITHFFADVDGKAVESIPPKLAEFDETILTLAVPVLDGVLQAEPAYLSGAETSCIYTYLPMNESRIRLPFLINADFVPSSDREELQGDNLWNAFILAKAAYCHISWLEELACLAIDNKPVYRRYLSILLDDLLTGDFAVSDLIVKYNEAYETAISKAAFILSDKNAVIRADETVLDTTGISGFEGGALFYKLSGEKRSLPNPELESSYLSAAYLKIAVFSDKMLLEILSGPDSPTTLSKFISGADNDEYLAFLGWLSGFLSGVGKTSAAIPALPLVRTGGQVLTISEAIKHPTLLIKIRKFEAVEQILIRSGLELTEFYLDDFPSLIDGFRSADDYLVKNERLFERIAAAPKLTSLSPADKNALLHFVSGLPGIGEKRYAGELKLFGPAIGPDTNRALNEMIVSAAIDLPPWLASYTIQAADEVALDEQFSVHLIQADEIFKKLLADPNRFSEISLALKPSELNSFYSFLAAKALTAEKADREAFQTFDSVYASGEIPWRMPSDVYFTDSLIGLSSEKFNNIQKAAAALSGAAFPHPATLAFIKAADLQCRSELKIANPAVLDGNVLWDFLNWYEDKKFFEIVCIKATDGGYSVDMNTGTIQYNNVDGELQPLIDAAAEEKKLAPLPNKLYFNGIESLGLLTGINLLYWMIANGFAVPELAVFISRAKSGALAVAYLDALEDLSLNDKSGYGPKTSEHIILDLLINQSGGDETYLKTFSEKITINGNNLAVYNVSDRVSFKFRDETKRIDREYELNLSNILPIYKNSAKTVTDVLNHITDFRGRNTLRDKVFCAAEKPLRQIAAEIEEDAKKFLTTWQVFFLLLYQEKFPDEDLWSEKDDFAVWFKDEDPEKYERLCKKLISIFYEHRYGIFLSGYSFAGTLSDKLIAGSELITDQEEMPDWLTSWLEEESREQRLAFLVQAGLQGPESQAVLLRDAIQNNKAIQFEKSLAMIEDSGQLSRTMTWIANNQTKIKLPLNTEVLKALYRKCSLLQLTKNDLPIPVMTSAASSVYRLMDYELTGDVHLKNEGWKGYENEVFAYVKSINGEIIDDLMPNPYTTGFAQVTESVIAKPDGVLLEARSFELPASFYKEWPKKATWPVAVYRGEALPGHAVYCGSVIKKINYGYIAQCADRYYIRGYTDLHDLMFLLRNILPEDAMNSLRRFKEEYDERKRREQEEANYSEEELAALGRMFNNDVPRSFFKDLNLASLIKGIFYLKDQGYDTAEAENNLAETHHYSNLFPVYPPGSSADAANALTVSCRSAKGGLLFLKTSTWKNLALPLARLYILTGKDYMDCRFCSGRDEILSAGDADIQVMRIHSGKKASVIDDVLSGKSNPDDLQLIIRMKKSDRYDSVFEDIYRKQQSDTIRSVQTGNEDLF